jgi:hypothetical protein
MSTPATTRGGAAKSQSDVLSPLSPTSTDTAVGCEGLLDRKVLIDGGKDSKRRGWQSIFVAVTGSSLYFFKDAKDRKRGKKPIAFFGLQGSVITEPTDSETSRRGAFIVKTRQEKVVLQPPDEADSVAWISALEQAGATVAASFKGSDGSIEVSAESGLPSSSSSSSTSKGGRGHKWAAIKTTLNRYLRHRPQKDDVRQSGIFQDCCFGGSLVGQVQVEAAAYDPESLVAGVPLVIVKCVEVVDDYLDEQGIYRVSGNASQMQRLALEFNQDASAVNLRNTHDVHTVSGAFALRAVVKCSTPLFVHSAPC